MEEGRVHVWCAMLDALPQAAAPQDGLSEDERRRAAALKVPAQRRRYIAGRAMMRDIVARAVGGHPAALRFAYGPLGRPAVAGEHVGSGVDFNLSHGGGVAVLALVRGAHVGADVERIRDVPRAAAIMRRWFSPSERRERSALPADERAGAFMRAWTCKEAVRKAEGTGLRHSVRGVEVAPIPGTRDGCPARLTHKDGVPAEAARWALWVWAPYPDWVAAVAVDRPAALPPVVHWWQPPVVPRAVPATHPGPR